MRGRERNDPQTGKRGKASLLVEGWSQARRQQRATDVLPYDARGGRARLRREKVVSVAVPVCASRSELLASSSLREDRKDTPGLWEQVGSTFDISDAPWARVLTVVVLPNLEVDAPF